MAVLSLLVLIRLLTTTSASHVSALLLLVPAVTARASAPALGEAIHPLTVIGMAIAALGVGAALSDGSVSRRRRARGRAPRPPPAAARSTRDPRVDKITFTGSTAAGRRIGGICGERIARCTLELGGKSAAVILDDVDLGTVARSISGAECFLSGQVCSSLTRIVVPRHRHDELLDALSETFSQVRVGDPFDPETQMGPLASERQRERVLGYIDTGRQEGATLTTGGGRPAGLENGWFVEPTVFGDVDNRSWIAQEEIFGPVLSVIPADDEQDAVRIANDTIYGLNASVFTDDVERARAVAARLRSGTVGHNVFRTDFGIAFGGFKQSGIGREGGLEGLHPFLECKTVILEDRPAPYAAA